MSDAAAKKITKQSKTRELMIKTHELNAKQRCEYVESNGKKWYNGLYGMIAFVSSTHFSLQKEPSTMWLMYIVRISMHVFMHLNIWFARWITQQMNDTILPAVLREHTIVIIAAERNKKKCRKIEESVIIHARVLRSMCCMCNRQFFHFRKCHSVQHTINYQCSDCMPLDYNFICELPSLVDFDSFKWKHIKIGVRHVI